jgi:hypothetical protein
MLEQGGEMVRRSRLSVGIIALLIMSTILLSGFPLSSSGSAMVLAQDQNVIVIEMHDIFYDLKAFAIPANTDSS